jgi:hypothetical protein
MKTTPVKFGKNLFCCLRQDVTAVNDRQHTHERKIQLYYHLRNEQVTVISFRLKAVKWNNYINMIMRKVKSFQYQFNCSQIFSVAVIIWVHVS